MKRFALVISLVVFLSIFAFAQDGETGSNRTSFYLPLTLGAHAWDYGASTLDFSAGLRIGAKIIRENFSMNIAGEFGGYLGPSLMNFQTIGFIMGGYYGGMMEIFLSPKYGFGIGGGITSGYLNDPFGGIYDNKDQTFSFPYLELELILGDVTGGSGIFTRFYFNDAEWYNKFAIGLRIKFDFFAKK